MERFNKTLDIREQNLTWGSKYVISLNMSLLNHPSKGQVIGLEKKRKKETRPNYSLSVGDVHQSRWDKGIEREGVGEI